MTEESRTPLDRTSLTHGEIRALQSLKERLAWLGLIDLRVFGSKIRGDAAAESDIDVMIELEDLNPEIEARVDETVFRLNLQHDCLISAVLFSRRELEEGPMSESPLYKNIEREGIRL